MSAPQVPVNPHDARSMPYKIAVLCYLYDTEGRLLLLHRRGLDRARVQRCL